MYEHNVYEYVRTYEHNVNEYVHTYEHNVYEYVRMNIMCIGMYI